MSGQTVNHREAIAAVSTVSHAPEYLSSTGGALNVNAAVITGGLITVPWDYLSYTNTNATTDTYVYKTGGSGGTTVATVTIVYTDSTKTTVSTVTKT